jgi:hypothetical protein
MAKTIISVGYQIPGHSDIFHRFSSDQSLLGADIIVFQPTVDIYSTDTYLGLPSLGEDQSFRVKRASQHWRADLKTAVEAGKTVFILLDEYRPMYVHTGRKEYSGTGRNARQTDIVEQYDNFQCLPLKLPTVTAKTGAAISFSGNPIFAAFWKEFSEELNPRCYFDEDFGEVIFTTKVGKKAVGSIITNKAGGHIIVLPAIPYDEEEFISETKAGKRTWTKSAIAFGARLVQSFIDIDKSIRSETDATPPPEWAANANYALASEAATQEKIAKTADEIAAAIQLKANLEAQLLKEGLLRALVYEKGKRLEKAIILALGILGFSAEEYDDGGLQLDQVILAPEGIRYIGEAEGKDTSAINIDKFRQLMTNIQEDLERDEVTEPAKGILFGNAHRLMSPEERTEIFTEKCRANAKRTGTALISTPDLFAVAKYIQEAGDDEFAASCREAIAKAGGERVTFPAVPKKS